MPNSTYCTVQSSFYSFYLRMDSRTINMWELDSSDSDVQGNANYLACESFVHSVLTHKRPEADDQLGWGEAVAVILGNQAIEQEKRIWFRDYIPKKVEASSS